MRDGTTTRSHISVGEHITTRGKWEQEAINKMAFKNKREIRLKACSIQLSKVQTPVVALVLIVALQVETLRSSQNGEEELPWYVLRVFLLEGLGDLAVLYRGDV